MGCTWRNLLLMYLNFASVKSNYTTMNLITLEESAWKAILEQLQSIRKHIEKDTSHWDELWLNQHEVCQYLHLSEKTLWRMRKNGEITYSKIYGQYFYTLGSIQKLLDANVVKSTDVYVQELTEKAKSYVEKARHFK